MAERGVVYNPTNEDRQAVIRMQLAQYTQAQIAAKMDISINTLKKHFMGEMETADAEIMGLAVDVFITELKAGSLDAAKFIAARKGKWSEKTEVEHSGSKENPVEIVFQIPHNNRDEVAKPEKVIDADE